MNHYHKDNQLVPEARSAGLTWVLGEGAVTYLCVCQLAVSQQLQVCHHQSDCLE